MLKHSTIIACLLLLSFVSHSQDQSTDAVVEKQFAIILSSPNYEDALRTAKTAAEKLRIKLDLRGLKKNVKTGLTFDKKTCESDDGDYPCYIARGRYDDGSYASIEYSNEYTGFTKGYYIVIISSGEKGDPAVKDALKKAKQFYADAYAKTTKVYVGCMH